MLLQYLSVRLSEHLVRKLNKIQTCVKFIRDMCITQNQKSYQNFKQVIFVGLKVEKYFFLFMGYEIFQ